MTEKHRPMDPKLSVEQKRVLFAGSLRVVEENILTGVLTEAEGEHLVKHQIARFVGMSISELALLGLNTRQLMQAILDAGPVRETNVGIEVK